MLNFWRCLEAFDSVINDNKIGIVGLEKVSDFPPFYNLTIVSDPELHVLILMNSIDGTDSHELFFYNCLNLFGAVILFDLYCQCSLIRWAAFQQKGFLDCRVANWLKFLKDWWNQILFSPDTDCDSLLHDIDCCFGLLAFQKFIQCLFNFTGTVGALDAGHFYRVDFWFW